MYLDKDMLDKKAKGLTIIRAGETHKLWEIELVCSEKLWVDLIVLSIRSLLSVFFSFDCATIWILNSCIWTLLFEWNFNTLTMLWNDSLSPSFCICYIKCLELCIREYLHHLQMWTSFSDEGKHLDMEVIICAQYCHLLLIQWNSNHWCW